MAARIAAPKPDLGAKTKRTILEHFLKWILQGKPPAPKWRNVCCQMGLSENRVYSQWNSHLIGIMISKTIGFRGLAYFQTHPNHHRNRTMQPLHLASAQSLFLWQHTIAVRTASTRTDTSSHPEFEQPKRGYGMITGTYFANPKVRFPRIREKNNENTQFQLGGFVFWFS